MSFYVQDTRTSGRCQDGQLRVESLEFREPEDLGFMLIGLDHQTIILLILAKAGNIV
jgi:hypothetical protein